MNKVCFAALFSAFFAISCSKSDDPATPAVVEKYMTLTPGSTWNYELTDNTSPVTTTPYTLTSTNRDSSISGKSYHVFTNSNGPNEYYNITSNNDYYTYKSLPSFISSTKKIDLYLITNQAKDFSWTQNYGISFGGVSQTYTVTNTIADLGLTKTVNGITYNNVIHVKSQVSMSGLTPGALTSDIHSYYAPKYGLIENTTLITYTTVGLPGSPPTVITQNTTTRLKTANLL